MIHRYVFGRETSDRIELGIIAAEEVGMVGSDDTAGFRRNTRMPCVVGAISIGTTRRRAGGHRGYCRMASIGNYRTS